MIVNAFIFKHTFYFLSKIALFATFQIKKNKRKGGQKINNIIKQEKVANILQKITISQIWKNNVKIFKNILNIKCFNMNMNE